MTLTATVTGASPTGTVTFLQGTTTLGTATLANGTASISYAFAAAGTYPLTASYGGDVNNNASTSPVTGQGVGTTASVYYIQPDQLGTPRTVTNTAGNVVWQWDNADPFGNNVPNENPSNQGQFSFNLRFPGQYADKETGLYYNVNRDYDPANGGRYIESDPIGLYGGVNTYTYVGGNPIYYADPLGLWCISQAWADAISNGAGGFVGGFIGSGGNLGVGLLTGGIGAVGGYYSSGKSVGAAAVAGMAGGYGAAWKGGGGVAGVMGGMIGGAASNILSKGAPQDSTENVSGGVIGGALGGLATGVMAYKNVSPLSMTLLGALGGAAGGLTQDLINAALKSHICNCDNKKE